MHQIVVSEVVETKSMEGDLTFSEAVHEFVFRLTRGYRAQPDPPSDGKGPTLLQKEGIARIYIGPPLIIALLDRLSVFCEEAFVTLPRETLKGFCPQKDDSVLVESVLAALLREYGVSEEGLNGLSVDELIQVALRLFPEEQ